MANPSENVAKKVIKRLADTNLWRNIIDYDVIQDEFDE